MKGRLSELWRSARSVTIKEAEPGLYLFQFFHHMDLERVLNGGPWSFDNFMLVLEKLPMGVAIQNIPLYHINFWIQAHNISVGLMTELVGRHLANFVGEFLEYVASNNSSIWRRYMRLSVRVDVCLPLKKERRVKMVGGEWNTVTFKYEKLGVFCFKFGCLGHTDQRCEVILELGVDDRVGEWSMELKADPRRGVVVPAIGGWRRRRLGGRIRIQTGMKYHKILLTIMALILMAVTGFMELIGGDDPHGNKDRGKAVMGESSALITSNIKGKDMIARGGANHGLGVAWQYCQCCMR